MAVVVPRSFDEIERVVEHLGSPVQWRGAIAEGLNAVTGEAAVVHTCPPGNLLALEMACAPESVAPIAEELVRSYLPRLGRDGGWQRHVEPLGPLFAFDAEFDGLASSRDAFEEIIAPQGFLGLVVALVLPKSIGVPVGGFTLYCRESPHLVLERHRQPLTRVMTRMGEHIAGVLDMAASVGMRAPRGQALPLSLREMQIALLVSQGHNNTRIAGDVGIAQSTVAVHLRRIYKKLGVHTRTQLARLVLEPR